MMAVSIDHHCVPYTSVRPAPLKTPGHHAQRLKKKGKCEASQARLSQNQRPSLFDVDYWAQSQVLMLGGQALYRPGHLPSAVCALLKWPSKTAFLLPKKDRWPT